MVARGGEFNFLQDMHERIDVRIEEIYDYQIWQTGTSTGSDSNETNQVGVGDIITSR